MIGFGICGSFCNHAQTLEIMSRLSRKYDIQPIISETAYMCDTRFGKASDFVSTCEKICGREAIHTITQAEPIGPRNSLEFLLICPCTGNTLAKLANGITDTAVTMAAKAHMRNEKPLVIALSTNDGLSGSFANIAELMKRKNIYFIPFSQDDPGKKKLSLSFRNEYLEEAIETALSGKQMHPVIR